MNEGGGKQQKMRTTGEIVEFDPEMAREYGINKAIVHSIVSEMNVMGKRPTAAELSEEMPYFSITQIKHALRGLESVGLLESEQPGMTKLQMAKVYTANKDKPET